MAASLRDADLAAFTWPERLMPFQEEGVATLLQSPRLLLADDMGLGKTIQTIAALRILHARSESESALVVAPAGILLQWRRELDKWAPELSAIIVNGPANERAWKWASRKDVKLVSYDTLRSDFTDSSLSPLRRQRWGVVVADEAQRIKNRGVATSRAVKELRRARSWALTGTPIENNEDELASILEFVDQEPGEKPKRYSVSKELFARHRELQLRRRKLDVLPDLPPKLVSRQAVELLPAQRKAYDKAELEGVAYLKRLGAEVSVQHVLALIMRLKQICNADPRTGESSKLDDIGERLEQLTAQGHRALIFSQFKNEPGVETALVRLQPYSPLAVTGDMPYALRQEVIDEFKRNGDHKALVLSVRAGGLGLNLQEASYVFHLDRWWNPATKNQAEDRAHRLGQTEKVHVFEYSCVGTIEQRIDDILDGKQRLFDLLVDDVSLDLSAQMSREEIFGLFNLEAPPQSPRRTPQ